MSTKTAIVTGVTGQMGSFFTEFLLAKNIKVIGTVRRLSVKNHENIAHIENPLFTLAPMDLGDPHSINALIEIHRPDYFINCAANSFVGSSWDYPEQHFDYNALGVLRQLEAIKRFSPHTRYINFGSSEEFGDVAYSPQDEKHPPRARSPYGASKIAARQIVKVYRESFGLYAIQCWCFNYESCRRGAEFVSRKITLGVARIAAAIRDGKPFDPIELGNLDAKRDWSDARDFVDGIWRMMNQSYHEHEGMPAIDASPEWWDAYDKKRAAERAAWQPSEYVLASGETHTVRGFVTAAFFAAGFTDLAWGMPMSAVPESERLHADGHLVVRINPIFFRPCEVALLQGDSTRARTELGWSPTITFPQLVHDMVKADLADVGIVIS